MADWLIREASDGPSSSHPTGINNLTLGQTFLNKSMLRQTKKSTFLKRLIATKVRRANNNKKKTFVPINLLLCGYFN